MKRQSNRLLGIKYVKLQPVSICDIPFSQVEHTAGNGKLGNIAIFHWNFMDYLKL